MLEVFGFQAGMFSQSRQHFGTDLFSIVKSEYHIDPASAPQNSVRT